MSSLTNLTKVWKLDVKFGQVSTICIEDKRISGIAKSIYTYMATRPDGWVIRTTHIIKCFKECKDTIYKGINELIDHKYIYRFNEYQKGKRGMVQTHYIVCPRPYSIEEVQTKLKDLVPIFSEANKVIEIISKKRDDTPQVSKNTNKNLVPVDLEPNLSDNYYNHNINTNKKNTSYSTGNSCRSFPVLEFNFISDNGRPLAKDSWCGTYVLKTQAERPILNIVSRLSRQKVKPDPVAIEEVVNYWNSFADRCKHNDLQVIRHNLATSKTLYKIQVLVTSLLADGTTTSGIKKAIDNFEDLLLRSPHYSNNRRFSLPMFLIMPQSDPGRLFDDCLTGEYASSKKYFPNKYKKTLTYFVDLMINREKSANGYISDMTRRDIISDLAPTEYLYYLMEKGGTREECRAIVSKERKKLLTYL